MICQSELNDGMFILCSNLELFSMGRSFLHRLYSKESSMSVSPVVSCLRQAFSMSNIGSGTRG